jgi:hypothetical protein
MPATYTLISSVTVGSGGAANIEFTSIPTTYTDLLVKTSTRTVGTSARFESIYLQFNSNASSYSYRMLQGSGSAASSGSASSRPELYLGETTQSIATASTFNNAEIYIPNYLSSNNKSVSVDNVQEDNQTTAYLFFFGGLWGNSASITSIKLITASSNFAQHSTAYLYGISNA